MPATAAAPRDWLPADRFDNRFVRDLPGDPETRNSRRQVHGACWSPVEPTPVAAPSLLACSAEAAALLDLDEADTGAPGFADVFAGNALRPGMKTYAACYGGHQFGNWAGQLGDGRAIGLGEYVNQRGERWELQLKGAGPTPYSRTADGRAVLRSSVREFLCSEAMHHLGVPTTRALSLVGTGESVVRDMLYDGNPGPEPGAVVCRLSPSFLRFGNYELPASRGDHELLRSLVDFTIDRDFPWIEGDAASRRRRWFREICTRTAVLVAHWMRVGFVHGVLNTDNMSVLGLTIDYGPYGWIDDYDPGWTPNTTDAAGHRYAYGKQPGIALWNLACLAGALRPLFADADELHHGLDAYRHTLSRESEAMTRAKFGLDDGRDDEDVVVINDAFGLMKASGADMTGFFRDLAVLPLATPGDAEAPDRLLAGMLGCFYEPALVQAEGERWKAWLGRYSERVRRGGRPDEERRASMNLANPRYVLRNYLAQEAIDLAEAGDLSRIHELLDVMRRPYDERPGLERFAALRPDWAKTRVGCSMLSCSS